MQVLIIEDEKIAADYLVAMLRKYDAGIEVMHIIDTVSEAVSWLSLHTPDLIFCDIHLADDMSFAIFQQVQVASPIIFTTAYDQYAIKAFKLNSIDYLLKPIDEKELFQSIEKYKGWQTPHTKDLQTIAELLKNRVEYKERFLVNSGQKLVSVSANQIAYFHADNKVVCLITNTNQKYVVDLSLDKLDQVLDPNVFFRINRQYIVNIHAIAQMFAYSKSRVKLELIPASEKEIIVSVERSGEFKEWLNK